MEFTSDQLEGRADARFPNALDPYEHESVHPGFNEYWAGEKHRHGPGHMLPPYGDHGGALREMWDAAFELGQQAPDAKTSEALK